MPLSLLAAKLEQECTRVPIGFDGARAEIPLSRASTFLFFSHWSNLSSRSPNPY